MENWDEAVLKISDEDHYLLALIGNSSLPQRELPAFLRRFGAWIPSFEGRGPRPPGDLFKLFLVGVVLGGVIFLGIAILAVIR